MKRKKLLPFVLVAVLLATTSLWLNPEKDKSPVESSPEPPSPAAASSEPRRISDIESTLSIPAPWTGDFDGMRKRRLVRILVPYNKTHYFLDKGQARGMVHDAGREFEKWLNRKYGTKTLPVRVVFIPTRRAHLLQDLIDGYGDIAAGNLTITQKREKIVEFTETGLKNISEIVVTGPATPDITSYEDFAAYPVYVRKSSSYHEHLVAFAKEHDIKLNIQPADEILEDADLLEMVNSGLLPLAVVDDHKARFWAQIFTEIQLHEDLAISRDGRIAWAIRKNSPLLKAELDAFGVEHGRRKGLANMMLKRYLGSTKYVLQAMDSQKLLRFDALIEIFRKHAAAYDLDPMLLVAQGFQESRLKQSVRSRAGAVGVMQVLPKTAASKPVQISNVDKDVDRNIEAGAKYMRYLIDTYLDDPEIDERNRLLLGLAAYNAGPGNLKKIRRKTVEMGLDRNIWFNNVEHGAAKVIGRETVQYVSNIYKYYLAYLLVDEQGGLRLQRFNQHARNSQDQQEP